MTRIAHVLRTYLGPTDTFIYTQLKLLRRYQAIVVARDLDHLDRYPGVDHVAFSQSAHGPAKRMSDLLYSRLRIQTAYERAFFTRMIGGLQPALIHAHFAVEMAYFAASLRSSKQPVVVSCYGYDVSSFPRRYAGLARFYLRRAWSSAQCFLAMSQDMRDDMLRLGCPSEKIRVHYHGINLQRFPYMERPAPSDVVRILYVGSLGDERKGVPDVIRAFARLAREHPNVELRIVGAGRLRDDFERLVQGCGVGDRVVFAGFVRHEELWREYQAAHLFCHPSMTPPSGDKEGIPGTIVEAMATGLPVVTTAHAGIPEMVLDGEHGFVVAEGDVDGIFQGLRRLADEPELRTRMGGKAAERASSRGDAVRQTAALESIYDDVIAAWAQGHPLAT